MVCTLKIVSTTCFSAVEHATADRVVASVIDHPFIVSYFCVFSVDEKCTVTVMEYVKAVDLQKGKAPQGDHHSISVLHILN